MKLSLYGDDLSSLKVDLMALGISETFDRSEYAFSSLDKALGGLLSTASDSEGFKGKEKTSITLHTGYRIGAARLLLVGMGKAEEASPETYRKYAGAVSRRAGEFKSRAICLVFPPPPEGARWAVTDLIQAVAEGAILGGYRFDRYMAAESRQPRVEEARIAITPEAFSRIDSRAVRVALIQGEEVAGAVGRCRDLVNEPPSLLTPEAFSETARTLAKSADVSCKIMNAKDMEKAGMNLVLSVGRGSSCEPRLVHLTYPSQDLKKRPARRLAIVGKGITFDSGGISIKSPKDMEWMKADMAGAAAVLCALELAARFKTDFTVDGVIALAENMPGPSAVKPGDIVKSMSGKSVEIVNSDAEGRLILADALTYAVRGGATELIDLATLTGACMVALGRTTAGLFANDDRLASRLLTAAAFAGEDLWRLPLNRSLRDGLKSDVADLKNAAADRYGGAITAALFLKEFAGDLPWAHVDIAGPAFSEKDGDYVSKGGTGFGVRTLGRLICLDIEREQAAV